MEKKKCTICDILLPVVMFRPTKLGRLKVHSICRACANKKAREFRKEHPDEYKAWRLNYYDKNKSRVVRYSSEWRRENISRCLLIEAKRRSKSRGLVFDLDINDVIVPAYCPVLGIPIKVGVRKVEPGSPTLDRIVPSLGYTKGNVLVVSHLANSIKYTANPTQIRMVAEFYSRLYLEKGIPIDSDWSREAAKSHVDRKPLPDPGTINPGKSR